MCAGIGKLLFVVLLVARRVPPAVPLVVLRVAPMIKPRVALRSSFAFLRYYFVKRVLSSARSIFKYCS